MELVAHRLLSPAKVNLMLRILSQRIDGYHELQTCFQLLDWGDEIHVNSLDSDFANHIEISGFNGLKSEDNLIFKAAQLLKPFAKNQSSWQIHVDKKIPLGAGLGGGSSNAATVMKFLNKKWQCDFSLKELIDLGVHLGADIPIFILGKSALAGGVGEKLQPMNFNTSFILLMLPQCSISTVDLFADNDLQRAQSELNLSRINESDFWINDFFPVILNKEDKVSRIYHQLKDQFNIRLSGTGSTMFAVFNTYKDAKKAFELSENICHSVITKPLCG